MPFKTPSYALALLAGLGIGTAGCEDSQNSGASNIATQPSTSTDAAMRPVQPGTQGGGAGTSQDGQTQGKAPSPAGAAEGGSDNAAPGGRSQESDQAPREGQIAPEDRQFFLDAASGGMFETESSELAQGRVAEGGDEEQFAKMMLADHGKANQELMQLAARKGVDVPEEMNERHEAMLEKLRGMEGPEFEKAYHDAQVQAHDEAVALFQKASQGAKDPEVKAFAAKTLPVLKKHRDALDGHKHEQ